MGRPIVIAGDKWQLVPATLSANQKYNNGHSVNPLVDQHKRSAHEHFMAAGWPTFVLREQRRMYPGLFEPSMEIFYKGWQLCYAVENDLGAHPMAQRCEQWATERLRIKPSPAGRVFGAFLHVPDTQVIKQEITESRVNQRALNVLVTVLNDMKERLQIAAGDVAIVTPYKAQLKMLVQKFGHVATLGEVEGRILLTTADRFQGNERKVVLFLMVNTAESGAGFLFDPNRLNVICTRGSESFLVIGDKGVAKIPDSAKHVQADAKYLRLWVDWYVRRRRVADASRLSWLN